MSTTFDTLPLASIVASTTNPRKTFNQAKLQELADSIKASGVHQPILVRPLPGARVADTDRCVTHEVVTGERRLRASQMAGVDTIPAMIRELDDSQVREIQIVENLQRDDLSELEEAEGYEQLMQHADLTADQVAAKIGKSRSYVYARIKLLDLCQEGREVLANGKIEASTALLVARIPDTKLQADAIKKITAPGYLSEVMSYREAQVFIHREYMLSLSKSVFKITDADLLPEAGSCKQCQKRTGANPDLFSDVKSADTCTDPECYRKKEQAYSDRLKRDAHERGVTIIDGREAKSLIAHSWSKRVDGYLRLDDKEDSPTSEPLRKLIGKVMAKRGIQEVLIANPYKDGDFIAALPSDVAAELLREASATNSKAAEAADMVEATNQAKQKQEAREAKEKAARDYEASWRWQMLESTWEKIRTEAAAPWSDIMRHIAMRFASSLNQDRCRRLCKLLQLGKVAPKEGFLQWIRDIADPFIAVQLLVMESDVEYRSWLNDQDDPQAANKGLILVADEYGIAAADIQGEVKKAIRSAMKAAEKEQKSSGADGPAAQARGVRGESETKPTKNPGKRKSPAAPKMSEEEAKLGIAAAMQGMEQAQTSAPNSEVNAADRHATHRLQVKRSPAKYRGPNGETWSGRGLMPRWLQVLIDQGGTKEQYQVQEVAA